MRQQLDIYASIVVCKSLPGFPTRHSNVDFAIIRENTEGEYSGLEHQSYPGVVESLKVSTRAKAERISRFAFDFALKNKRKVCFNGNNTMFRVLKIVLESDMCAQSQHHETRRWLVPEYFPKGCGRVPIFRYRIQ
jgi:isocitrate/isopropylmalate dehydrogenase